MKMTEKIKKQITNIAKRAKSASQELLTLTTKQKNKVLNDLAKEIIKNSSAIQKANTKDIKYAKEKGLNAAMIDRLILNEQRIKGMANAVKDVAKLTDPIGEITEKRERAGLKIKKMRIPLGVMGMIYESRPNVTVDAFSLSFKAGNAIVLRGGSEAFHSNKYLVSVIQKILKQNKLNPNAVSMVPFTDRKAMIDLMQLDEYIDLLIPRGGEGLMKFIKEHSKIPVIKHDKGVCSIFVDESAKLNKALEIILNAKTQRPGVCNALEHLYVHQNIAVKLLKVLSLELHDLGVEIRGDKAVKKIIKKAKVVADKELGVEYLDLILSIKIVKDIHEAISLIQKYSSRHTESILTENKKNAKLFIQSLDSSCVMVNTSTRFNDGGELGLGAEIGISTTKLHAYGPMGLRELTTTQFVVESFYKIRN